MTGEQVQEHRRRVDDAPHPTGAAARKAHRVWDRKIEWADADGAATALELALAAIDGSAHHSASATPRSRRR